MDVSAIAALSTEMQLSKVQQQASISIMKKAMDLQENTNANLIQTLQQSNPVPGAKLDVYA